MGYAFCYGICFGCKKHFGFNPMKVPSIRVDGVKEPICESCVKRVNPTRKANGLMEIVILPGAYEPCDENELN